MRRFHPTSAGSILALAIAMIPALARADFTEEFTITAERLLVGSLIGEITLEGHEGADFVVHVDVQGEDADPELIQFEQQTGSDASLLVVFPVEEHDRFVYPRMGRRSRTTFRLGRHGEGSTWFEKLLEHLGREKIEVRGSGDGLEVWADVTIRVPAGKEIAVDSGVGSIEAREVASSMNLRMRSGHITAETVQGDVVLDTGSGHVEALEIDGALAIDTGSGHVEVMDVEGEEIEIDTGSGHVDLDAARATTVAIDTGSGRVTLDEVDCTTLRVDTGSGSVQGRRVASDEAEIDTGSGSVELTLVRMGDGPYVVDTGSGSITLRIPEDASGAFYASTGSGSIDVDVDDADFRRKKRDHVAFDLGEAKAEVELETGSGGIRIVQR